MRVGDRIGDRGGPGAMDEDVRLRLAQTEGELLGRDFMLGAPGGQHRRLCALERLADVGADEPVSAGDERYQRRTASATP